jgi:hypothetical protein
VTFNYHNFPSFCQIGEGRCCLVYSAHSVVNDSIQVALKVYRVGPNYEGALQREQYMMAVLADRKYNVGEWEEAANFINIVEEQINIEEDQMSPALFMSLIGLYEVQKRREIKRTDK